MAIEIEVDVYVESARELNGYIVIDQKLISTGLMEFAGRLGAKHMAVMLSLLGLSYRAVAWMLAVLEL